MEMLETLLQGVRSACAAFPDKRRGDVTYSMADIGLSAFSLFFLQSESFLAHQRALEEGRKTSNCQSLFGMTAIPTDNHIRAMLDLSRWPKVLQQASQPEPFGGHGSLATRLLWCQRQDPGSCIVGQGVD